MRPELTEVYLRILEEELKPAVGCTEPLALAYAAALLRKYLDTEPEWIKAVVSGNIVKNAKSVTVPNTAGLKGIAAAIAIGVVAGDPSKELEVIADVPEETPARCRKFLESATIDIRCMDTPHQLDILLEGCCGKDCACVRITSGHTKVVYLEKNGEVLLDLPTDQLEDDYRSDRSILNIRDIVAFAEQVDIVRLKRALAQELAMNMAIADEGMKHHYGSNIGKIILGMEDSAADRAVAYAAAGSDARMSGCCMPVVILSGSGNQGLTASVSVAHYGQVIDCSEEKIYRALAISALITIHLKTGIGKLSAYCGAVSAGCGAGAGIAYLRGAGEEQIALTVNNALGILSGMICDGAKPSCACKIAMAVRAGILAYEMVLRKSSLGSGDGIIGADVEDTITNIGLIGREGMRSTDRVILDIMLGTV